MKKSIINYQGISKQVVVLMENTQNSIVAAMQAQNVRLISFVRNGDNSSYDVPKAFALDYNDAEGDYTFKEVICVFHDDVNLFLVIDDNNLTNEELNKLDNIVALPIHPCDANTNIDFIENSVNISDIYNPTELTLELAESIEAVLVHVLNSKRIKGIVYLDNII